jgi:hypothetical protein
MIGKERTKKAYSVVAVQACNRNTKLVIKWHETKDQTTTISRDADVEVNKGI